MSTKKFISGLLAGTLIFSTLCTVPVQAKVKVSKSVTLSLKPGNRTKKIKVKGTKKKKKFKSADKSVATVNKKGQVTAVRPGDTKITVKIGKKKYKVKVKVNYALNKSNLTLKVGEGYMLQLYAVKNVKWTTSDKNVATVNDRGVVCGRHKGEAIITAHYGIFDLNAIDCLVTVKSNGKSKKSTAKSTDSSKGKNSSSSGSGSATKNSNAKNAAGSVKGADGSVSTADSDDELIEETSVNEPETNESIDTKNAINNETDVTDSSDATASNTQNTNEQLASSENKEVTNATAPDSSNVTKSESASATSSTVAKDNTETANTVSTDTVNTTNTSSSTENENGGTQSGFTPSTMASANSTETTKTTSSDSQPADSATDSQSTKAVTSASTTAQDTTTTSASTTAAKATATASATTSSQTTEKSNADNKITTKASNDDKNEDSTEVDIKKLSGSQTTTSAKKTTTKKTTKKKTTKKSNSKKSSSNSNFKMPKTTDGMSSVNGKVDKNDKNKKKTKPVAKVIAGKPSKGKAKKTKLSGANDIQKKGYCLNYSTMNLKVGEKLQVIAYRNGKKISCKRITFKVKRKKKRVKLTSKYVKAISIAHKTGNVTARKAGREKLYVYIYKNKKKKKLLKKLKVTITVTNATPKGSKAKQYTFKVNNTASKIVADAFGPSVPVKWKISKEGKKCIKNISIENQTLTFSTVKKGSFTITATYYDKTQVFKVTVK